MADVESRMEARVRGKGNDGPDRDYNRTAGNIVYASIVHRVTRPIDGVPIPITISMGSRSMRPLTAKRIAGRPVSL
jgi:hypothetical protein